MPRRRRTTFPVSDPESHVSVGFRGASSGIALGVRVKILVSLASDMIGLPLGESLGQADSILCKPPYLACRIQVNGIGRRGVCVRAIENALLELSCLEEYRAGNWEP